MPIAKAITALILTGLTLALGSDVSSHIDAGAVETVITSIIVAAGVYLIPNTNPNIPKYRGRS